MQSPSITVFLQSLYFAHFSAYHSSGSVALGTRQPQRGQAKKVGRWQPSSRCRERRHRRRRPRPGFATAIVAVGSSPVSFSGAGVATAPCCLFANRLSSSSLRMTPAKESLLGSVHTLCRTFAQRNFQMLLLGHHVVSTQQLFLFHQQLLELQRLDHSVTNSSSQQLLLLRSLVDSR